MTSKERNFIKKCILEFLTTDKRGHQSLFDKKEGWAVWSRTDLTMVMGCVVKGLYKAQKELKRKTK
jgi:hypothetical protein